MLSAGEKEDASPLLSRPGNDARAGGSRKAAGILVSLVLLAFAFERYAFSAVGFRMPLPVGNMNASTGARKGPEFFPCPGQPKFECADVIVPKDYFNASAGTSTVAIAAYRATSKPSKGTLFLGAGGPGGSGQNLAFRLAETFSLIVHGEYDIVGYDPRGVHNSRPVVQCFSSRFEHQVFGMGTVLERAFELPPDPESPEGYAHIVQQWAAWRALYAAQYQLCGEKYGEELKHMGTSTVVRDIDYMAKLFDGPDALINFYGGSYGTIVGAYLVNMLPERAGHIVIDGVVDPVVWGNVPTHKWGRKMMVETEDTYGWLLDACAEVGPTLCPLSKANDTAAAIAARVDDYLDQLYRSPVPVSNHSRPGILTSGQARATLFQAVASPLTWPHTARLFAQAMGGDATALYDDRTRVPELPPQLNGNGDLARSAVSCADAYVVEGGASAEDLAAETLDLVKTHSPRFAMTMASTEPDGACEFWPTKGREPERFVGPFNQTLPSGSMLILSALSDPVTPLAAAQDLHKLMPESTRVLIQDTPGHTTHAMGMGLCVAKALRAYYLDGTLPENEQHCAGDRDIFEKDAEKAGSTNNLAPEDAQLVERLQRASKAFVELQNQ